MKKTMIAIMALVALPLMAMSAQACPLNNMQVNIKAADANHDGKVTKTEYYNVFKPMHDAAAKPHAAKNFSALDKNGDSVVSSADYRMKAAPAAKNAAPKPADAAAQRRAMFVAMDQNKDGMISPQEFRPQL